jgi:hypothetical protein
MNTFFLHALLQALYVCLEHWKKSEHKELCVKWLKPRHEELFGEKLNQHTLRRLADLGLLQRGDLNHGGSLAGTRSPTLGKSRRRLRDFR